MAIHAITGVMGSGKSYEAVSEKIIPALRDDDHRRVITNIEGLDFEAIAAFVNRPVENIRSRLIAISYERVSEPGFWYDPEGGDAPVITTPPHCETSRPVPPALDTLVQPGDLVVLDEVWRYFNRGDKLPADAMRFFRMHRHYVHETSGHTCDVVLINQALRGIHQDIRDVIEVQFACRKLKVLGRPQNYQVFVHEGGERKPSHSYLRSYNKDVFPLYSSYTHKNAKESVDKRQSALSKPFFKYVLPGALVASIFATYTGITYFNKLFTPPGATPAKTAATAPGAAAPGATPSDPAAPVDAAATPSVRLVASYRQGSVLVAVVDDAGVYRSYPVSALQSSPLELFVAPPPPPPAGFIAASGASQ